MPIMGTEDGVAERIARLRKLAGWTQYQLAARAFVSTSLIKKVEQGRTPPSPALVAACSRALGVDAALLYGINSNEPVSDQALARAGIEALRDALYASDAPEDDESGGTVSDLRRALDRADQLRASFRYEELCQRLPRLLHALFVQCAATREGTTDGETVRALLHDAYRLTATVAGRFGHPDLSALASERHGAIAALTGDPLRVALSHYHRSTYLLRHGHLERGLRLLDRAQDVARESGDVARHSVAVQLHLRSSVLRARAGDVSRADEHVREARALLRAYDLPGFPYYNINATATNADVHWCAIPVENEDGTASVTRAGTVRVSDPTQPERVGHHHIDMARAWLLHGHRDNVMVELRAARAISPDHTRRHPTVHETVRALAATDHRATDALAGFARWVGIAL